MNFAESLKNLYRKDLQEYQKKKLDKVSATTVYIVGMLIILLTMLAASMLFSGCKKGSGFLNVGKPEIKSSMSEIGMDVLKNINIASSTIKGIETPSISGITISTMSATMAPITISVLEKYDSPIVQIQDMTLYKKENIPGETKITKIKEYRNNTGSITRKDTDIYEPVKKQNTNSTEIWINILLVISTFVNIWFIVLIIKKMRKDKQDKQNKI